MGSLELKLAQNQEVIGDLESRLLKVLIISTDAIIIDMWNNAFVVFWIQILTKWSHRRKSLVCQQSEVKAEEEASRCRQMECQLKEALQESTNLQTELQVSTFCVSYLKLISKSQMWWGLLSERLTQNNHCILLFWPQTQEFTYVDLVKITPRYMGPKMVTFPNLLGCETCNGLQIPGQGRSHYPHNFW